jgi:hypothetical protein
MYTYKYFNWPTLILKQLCSNVHKKTLKILGHIFFLCLTIYIYCRRLKHKLQSEYLRRCQDDYFKKDNNLFRK